MRIEYDPNKNQRNIDERNLSFEQAALLEWTTALIWVDERFQYGETRWSALAYLADRLHYICFKKTDNAIRVISFRKANNREIKKYELHRGSRI